MSMGREDMGSGDMDVLMWRYEVDLGTPMDIEGYDVEALDGSIGKVDEATSETDASYLVVDTGPWIFGKKVLIPASAVQGVDAQERRVLLRLTKDQIRNAPEFDEETYRTPEYRSQLGTYYGSFRRAA